MKADEHKGRENICCSENIFLKIKERTFAVGENIFIKFV